MKVNVIENSKTSRTLEIEVPDESVTIEIETAFKKVSREANIPGFRKGKIPRDILEKKFRTNVEQEVIDKMIPQLLIKAIEENKLAMVGQPRVEGLGGGIPPLKFKATIDIKPEFKLKDVAGLKLNAPSEAVETKDIEEQLEQLRKRGATLGEAVDRKAAMGDHVILDFLGKLKGEPFEGGKAEKYGLTLGGSNFIPGFEEGVVGLKAGDTKDLKLKFPDDYNSEKLKGQKVVFEIKVHEVKPMELPDVDDAFAVSMGPFKTVDELKAKIKESLQEQKTQQRKNALAGQAEEQLAKKHKLELPEVMVGNEVRLLIERQSMQYKQQGMELSKDPAVLKELEKKIRPAAEHRATVRLVLEKIAAEQKLEIGHDELHKEIHKLAPGMGLNAEQAVQWFHDGGREEGLRQQLLEQKALEWVLEQAKVKEAK